MLVPVRRQGHEGEGDWLALTGAMGPGLMTHMVQQTKAEDNSNSNAVDIAYNKSTATDMAMCRYKPSRRSYMQYRYKPCGEQQGT